MYRQIRPFVAMLFCALLFASSAFAQTTKVLVNGHPRTLTSVTPPFVFGTAANAVRSSICCTAVASNLDAEINSVEAFLDGLVSQDFTYRGATAPVVPSQTAPETLSDKSRV